MYVFVTSNEWGEKEKTVPYEEMDGMVRDDISQRR